MFYNIDFISAVTIKCLLLIPLITNQIFVPIISIFQQMCLRPYTLDATVVYALIHQMSLLLTPLHQMSLLFIPSYTRCLCFFCPYTLDVTVVMSYTLDVSVVYSLIHQMSLFLCPYTLDVSVVYTLIHQMSLLCMPLYTRCNCCMWLNVIYQRTFI